MWLELVPLAISLTLFAGLWLTWYLRVWKPLGGRILKGVQPAATPGAIRWSPESVGRLEQVIALLGPRGVVPKRNLVVHYYKPPTSAKRLLRRMEETLDFVAAYDRLLQIQAGQSEVISEVRELRTVLTEVKELIASERTIIFSDSKLPALQLFPSGQGRQRMVVGHA